jgi:hypothetical protein
MIISAPFSCAQRGNSSGGYVKILSFPISRSQGDTMDRAWYFVVLSDGEWKIELQHKHYGPYSTQQTAIRAAVEAAQAAVNNGIDAEVLVQSMSNHEFGYDYDPYPLPA